MIDAAALSLGSNLGDRLGHLQAARDAVAALDGVTLLARSAVYETEPVDVAPAYRDLPYLNAVLLVRSVPDIGPLAAALHAIEAGAGRRRTTDRNAPRPLDIDIIFADDLVTEPPGPVLPHPRWQQRRFVVQPLADVCAERVLPGAARTVRETLLSLPDTPRVVWFEGNW
jgi:2-amino-4-hydroxy-6-hydroxymethyldihydropteridine diphosphokinase